jgi:hypothetical protein
MPRRLSAGTALLMQRQWVVASLGLWLALPVTTRTSPQGTTSSSGAASSSRQSTLTARHTSTKPHHGSSC